MSEIEKMYENAGLEKDLYCCDDTCGEPTKGCKDCPDYREIYPQFTAEKQIELIKWLANYERFCCWKFKPTNEWVIYDNTYMVDGRDIANSNFEECLASWINYIWQDLTEAEKQQVKGILE